MPPTKLLLLWLIPVGAFGVLGLTAKGKVRAAFRCALVVALSGFVIHALLLSYLEREKLSRQGPIIEADRAELLLRFDDSLKVWSESISQVLAKKGVVSPQKKRSLEQTQKNVARKQEEFKDEAANILRRVLQKRPGAQVLKAKLAIVLGETGDLKDQDEIVKLVRQLVTGEESKRDLGQAISAIYLQSFLPPSSVAKYKTILIQLLPRGWYQEHALLRLYKISGDTKSYEEKLLDLKNDAAGLAFNLTILLSVAGMAIVTGLVSIVAAFFVIPRRARPAEDEVQGRWPPPWGQYTAYIVVLSWLATQMLITSLSLPQFLISHFALMKSGSLIAGLSVAGLYLLTNGPALLYIYVFACRPYGVSFVDAVRLRTRVGRQGPMMLVLTAVLTWCAAIPLVALSFFLAQKYLGAQGSSNPIVALVLEAAHSSNYLAVIVFYLVLGVLAPVCEETLFRGFLYSTLRKRLGVQAALLLSAFLFAFLHLDVGAFVPLLVLGILFAFIFEHSKSLLPSLIAHALWNSGTFTLVLMLLGS